MPLEIKMEQDKTLQQAVSTIQSRLRDIKLRFNGLNDETAEKVEEAFVDAVLSESGPHSLGQETGRLAASLEVIQEESDEFGGLTVFVADDFAEFYGGIHDEEKEWFAAGIAAIKPIVIQEMRKILIQAVRDTEID